MINICELQLGHFIKQIPELVRRSIAICYQITIYCGIKYQYIQYVVVVPISQGCDFLFDLMGLQDNADKSHYLCRVTEVF